MNRNRVLAAPFFALSLYVVYSSLSMSIWADGPAEGFLPFALGCALLGLSAALCFQRERSEPPKKATELSESDSSNKAFYYYTFVLLFYSLVLQPLGFLLSTAISLAILLGWVEREGWRTTLVVAVGCNMMFYFIFSMLLGVPLPRGFLEAAAGI